MNKIKKMIPDALAVVFFILIGLAYFYVPTTEGLVLTGHDHTGGSGAGAELVEYLERTGEYTRWTNSQFGGMPTYQMSPSYGSTDVLSAVEHVYQLGLPTYVMYVFIMLLGFYILLRAFNFKVWMSALGAILWAFSSYYFIIIAAGHIWKFMALSFIPPTIAGLVLCYRGKYIAGGVVTAFFTALQIYSNHIQMSYYFLSVMLLMALAYLIQAVREHRVSEWFKATGVLAIAGILGIYINLSNLYHTYQYSKELLGKPPRMFKQVKRATHHSPAFDGSEISLQEAAERVLSLPTVAEKTFLITIGDRSVTGLVARDQMVGPWQVPVSDVAVTAASYDSTHGEAAAMGERTPVALLDHKASVRLAVGEAITNIAAACIGDLNRVKLSANWMAANNHGGEDAGLFDAVQTLGMELCPELGITVPVGKDSMSMKTSWEQDGEKREVIAPMSLIISSFARCENINKTLTPQLRTDKGPTSLIYIDLGEGAPEELLP